LLIEVNSKTILLIILVLILFCSVTVNIAAAKQEEKISKNVFIELFLNADCAHCPKAAFCLEELAWSYEPGRVILVEEHIWGDGYDIPQTNERYTWYTGEGVQGTPDVFINGLTERIQGLACCADIDESYLTYQEAIEKELTKTSPVELQAEQAIYGGKIIVQGTLVNKRYSNLHNLLLGGMVYYEGDESELFYVVKDVFDYQDICQLPPMDKRKFSFISSLDLSNLEEDELKKYRIVVFVQDKLTKEILQSFLAN